MPPRFHDTLEEISAGADAVPREHVVERLADWETRIKSLYDLIASWLPPGMRADRSQSLVMHAEMMTATGVASKRLPRLRLLRGDEEILAVEPEALWIVGANGRLKAYGAKGLAYIVDRAPIFEAPRWEIAFSPDRHATQPLSREAFFRLI